MANLPMPEGLSNRDLHAVMLELEPMDVRAAYGSSFDTRDLYFGSPESDLKYAQGDVGSSSAHVTLLFGLHPTESFRDDVLAALDGWDIPHVLLDTVGFFPSSVEGEDYKVIVGHIIPTVELLSGNKRLTALPHTNRFTEYRPHVTLAYIKGDADHVEWIRRMQEVFGNRAYPVLGLDLGE